MVTPAPSGVYHMNDMANKLEIPDLYVNQKQEHLIFQRKSFDL